MREAGREAGREGREGGREGAESVQVCVTPVSVKRNSMHMYVKSTLSLNIYTCTCV